MFYLLSQPEVEFLDIDMKKDSSLLLYAIYRQADFIENHTLLWF
jgi:hypothetical protein